MALEQQLVLLHEAIDALGVHRGLADGSPLALEERGDPPIAVGWVRIDQATEIDGELGITVANL